jgi:UDPglucose 6-dehydrogenase
MKIGLIGNGFVGGAIYENLKETYSFLIYDKDPDRSTASNIREVCHNSKIIFVALPTPMQKNGKCDLSIVFNVMNQISYWFNDNIVVLKSTVPPGTCEKIKKIHSNLRIVFSPEFLTEANSIEDFKNCNRVIFGGDKVDVDECIEVLSIVFPNKSYFKTNWHTAEMVKYFINTFLAVKVSFANEMKQICDLTGVDYDEIKSLSLQDSRIGKSHLMVPGPDGDFGFGGTCFAKDINSLIYFAEEIGADPLVLKSAWEKNLQVRQVKDWLQKEGRAVSSEEG